ncbi:putative dipeptidyl-peptidase III [Candidatus Sulfopaludibacter sp. SbA3]|nr:putative dipeptidyl-peptidase III [Candidatus Sulfopaludibacter sp. SbA3]
MRIALIFVLAGVAVCADDRVLVDRVGTTGFVQLQAESFKALSPQQQMLAYYLSQASIAADPINYDQNSRFGLRQKRLLETLMNLPPDGRMQFAKFTKLFWANRGNHNEMTAQKFLPEFSYEAMKAAAAQALKAGLFQGTPYGTPAIKTLADLDQELEALRPSLFDPNFEPLITAKSPQGGKDILQSSANNFYLNVSMADVANFHDVHPLNSRLVKGKDGKLVEEVYRAGTPGGKVPPGMYAPFLRKTNEFLEKARPYAEPGQDQVIAALIRYYQTGDPADWIQFGIAWVQNNPSVDFANGFIEVYRDARAAKATSQSFVSITDQKMNSLMVKLAQNAQYFEDNAPWAPQYKKQGVKPPLAKAVETAIETGDFHVTTVGDNLPNENEIREKYGSKSFLFTGSSRTLREAQGSGVLEEFTASPEEIAICKKYGEEASDMMTSLHEVIGHGSGKLSPRLQQSGAEAYLKEYFSTMEEARADLMALWSVFDPKLQQLGLISSPEVGKAMYYAAVRTVLTQLYRIPQGDTIEEDHQRNRQLIVNYVQDKTGAIAKVERNGKTYLALQDFNKMRSGVGMLLAELMRIKAEGDYAAIKALVDQYGVHFDPKLRDQVVARYQKLNLPSYWCGVNADLQRVGDKVSMSYPRDVVKQQLGYAAMYAIQ